MSDGTSRQLSFDEMGTSLRDTTFVVVDLETTGGRPGDDAITEIGAVKVRGGRVVGEMATLVDPGRSIPPAIVHLTGITGAMLVDAPRIERVLPTFVEFARGSVLVAHNARFDTAFLRAAATRMDMAWPSFPVLCTVKLARRVLSRDEAPSVKLSSLASLFQVSTRPTHRALDDARATVDVLHALIERVGNQGVHSYAELVDYLPTVPAAHRAKRSLAVGLPHAPGVYLFRGPSDEVLYVGTSRNLHRRVRTYFTGSETRGRMREMVALATRVDHVECSHAVEAGVHELRLISAHTPPYNRRSKYPRKGWWLTLTAESFPRISIVRAPTDGALGPFAVRGAAADAAGVIAEYTRLRSCTHRIPAAAKHEKCPVEAVGGCTAAGSGPLTRAEYADATDAYRSLVDGSDATVLNAVASRIDALSAELLFESAARLRDRTAILLTALRSIQRLHALARITQLVAARRSDDGGWDFVVVRYGRLASAGVARRGVPPMPVVEALVSGAVTVVPDATPLRGATPEEVSLLARWLNSGGVRIVDTTDGWSEPTHGAGRWAPWCATVREVGRSERERTMAWG
ncbi:MAG: DEDD exonuclease domain-containing protein [Rhodococcus sp. (in: high G+C Gram-positive bacteria)]